jgi:hypothetical protein
MAPSSSSDSRAVRGRGGCILDVIVFHGERQLGLRITISAAVHQESEADEREMPRRLSRSLTV